jgi:hypothetical protein
MPRRCGIASNQDGPDGAVFLSSVARVFDLDKSPRRQSDSDSHFAPQAQPLRHAAAQTLLALASIGWQSAQQGSGIHSARVGIRRPAHRPQPQRFVDWRDPQRRRR